MAGNQEKINALRDNLGKIIRGKVDVIGLFLTAVLSGGHALIEDAPGTGKTTLAKALAKSVSAKYSRIQFTPDLLPTDILGGMVYHSVDGSFTFRAGPIFANIVLADEINRASPRTQSALLEAMAERQVSIEGETRRLPVPFIVIATQNPIEFNGTYPLPEAQIDRFCMRLGMGYPSHGEELQVLKDQTKAEPIESLQPVMTSGELRQIQIDVREIEVNEDVLDYIVRIVERTRGDGRAMLGASPRGSLDLRRCAQAMALLSGRNHVRPEDVRNLAVPVLAHRIITETSAAHGGVTGKAIVEDALRAVSVPS